MAAYLELCDPGQVHCLPWLSVSLSVEIITATFNESRVLHCIKLLTNVISSS